ncbi:hypothetical protein FB001_103305 [Ensifer sp. SEMIA 135]|nr:hypothetical protein FB000_10422 [Ensifer sp. SEMIA 134]TWB39516.1 hypothetical protein FB001_103305 [Ensifer sp. SEMIA 135]
MRTAKAGYGKMLRYGEVLAKARWRWVKPTKEEVVRKRGLFFFKLIWAGKAKP